MSSHLLRRALRPYRRREWFLRFLREYFRFAAGLLLLGIAPRLLWYAGRTSLRPAWTIALAFATALPVALVMAERRPRRPYARLDKAAGTRFLFATVAEILKAKRDESTLTPVEDAIISRAVRAIKSRRPREDVPLTIPRTVFLVPLVLLLYSAVALATLSRSGREWTHPPVAATGPPPQSAPEAPRDSGAELAEELALLNELLDTRPEAKDFVFRSDEVPELPEGPLRKLGAGDLAAPGGEFTDAVDGSPEGRGVLEALPSDDDSPLVRLPGEGAGPSGGEGSEPSGPTNGAAAGEVETGERSAEREGNGAGSRGEPPEESSGDAGRPAESPGGTGSPGDESGEGRSGGGNPGTGLAEKEAGEAPPDLSDTIKELVELPRGPRGNAFLELFARELAGSAAAATDSPAGDGDFERQVQRAIARSDVPPELRGMIRDYFVGIVGAGRVEEESP